MLICLSGIRTNNLDTHFSKNGSKSRSRSWNLNKSWSSSQTISLGRSIETLCLTFWSGYWKEKGLSK